MAEAINNLKSKITNLREELEKSQDKYEAKCKEVEEEKKKRNEVIALLAPVFWLPAFSLAALEAFSLPLRYKLHQTYHFSISW